MSCDDQTKTIILEVLLIAGVVIEYWLGKTPRVRSASGLELAINTVKAVFTIIVFLVGTVTAKFKKKE